MGHFWKKEEMHDDTDTEYDWQYVHVVKTAGWAHLQFKLQPLEWNGNGMALL